MTPPPVSRFTPARSPVARRRACSRATAALLIGGIWAGGPWTGCGPPREPPAARPNILLLLADDLGMNDLAAFGEGNGPTPNLDRLAAQGVRFTRHYTHGTGAPSRAALLTGLHPSRLGFRPRGRGIPPHVETLAELLGEAGYATHLVGAWQLGREPAARPLQQGFDTWLGFLEARDLTRYQPGYFDPRLRAGKRDGGEAGESIRRGHLTDLLSERAAALVREGAGGEPWLLYLAFLAPHEPVQPAEGFAAKHPDGPRGRYAALLEQLDAGVGRVLAALEESGQAERTLVAFLADNGGTDRDAPNNAPFAGRKDTHLEGGLRTPLVLRWPRAHPPGRTVDEAVAIFDLLPTLAAAAGARVPPDLDGRDLAPLLRGGSLPGRPLFWEQYIPAPEARPGPSGRYRYSALSADGRFRLVRSVASPQLLDLERDPGGGRDAEVERPEIVAQLESLYRRWHDEVRSPLARLDRAGGWLRGDAFQGGPGFGGFSIAAELRLGAGDAPEREVIARQEGVWELVHDAASGLRARIGKGELRGPPLPRGACTRLTVTAHFHRSPVHHRRDSAVAELFVDGSRVDAVRFQPGSLPPPSPSTALGHDGAGGSALRGEIGEIAVVNERLEGSGAGFTPEVGRVGSDWCR